MPYPLDGTAGVGVRFLDKMGYIRDGIVRKILLWGNAGGKTAAPRCTEPIFTFFPKNLRFIRSTSLYLRRGMYDSINAYEDRFGGDAKPQRYFMQFLYYNPMALPKDAYDITDYVTIDNVGGFTWMECHSMIYSRFTSKLSMSSSELARYLNAKNNDKKRMDGMMAGENQFDPLNATWEFNDLYPKAGAYMSFDRLRERYISAVENFGDGISRVEVLAQSPVGDSNTPQYMSEYDIIR